MAVNALRNNGVPVADPLQAGEIQPAAVGMQPLVPDVQPLVPDVQPLVPDVQPLVPDVQPLVPDVQPLVPTVQPLVPAGQPLVPDVQLIEPAVPRFLRIGLVPYGLPPPFVMPFNPITDWPPNNKREFKEYRKTPLFSYPFEEYPNIRERTAVPLEIGDVLTLKENNCLNDNMVNFMLSYILVNLKKDVAQKIYLFSTFFHDQISKFLPQYNDWDTADHQPQVERNCESLVRWTFRKKRKTNVDIFAKDYVIIPINKLKIHWICVVIMNPSGAIVEEGKAPPADGCKIILMDSMGGVIRQHRERLLSRFATWLDVLFRTSKTGSSDFALPETFSFVKERVTIEVPVNLPLQDNFSDCGIYVFHYIEQFFNTYKPLTPKDFPYFDWLEQFPAAYRMVELTRHKTYKTVLSLSQTSKERLSRYEQFFEDGVSREETRNRRHSVPNRGSQRHTAYRRRMFSLAIFVDPFLNPREILSMEVTRTARRFQNPIKFSKCNTALPYI